jgi:hypothetical protein
MPHPHVVLEKLPAEYGGPPTASPALSSPRFKHELGKHVDNPIAELNDIPRARAPGDVVHTHSSCGALTRHRYARDRRERSGPTRLGGSLFAAWGLESMRGALRGEVSTMCAAIV